MAILNKEKRTLARSCNDFRLQQEYIELLEEIAKAGADVWQYTIFVPKGQQKRYQRLADALQKVDWMRE